MRLKPHLFDAKTKKQHWRTSWLPAFTPLWGHSYAINFKAWALKSFYSNQKLDFEHLLSSFSASIKESDGYNYFQAITFVNVLIISSVTFCFEFKVTWNSACLPHVSNLSQNSSTT
jgi:hypothetical protein